jgi:hypothetical protein
MANQTVSLGSGHFVVEFDTEVPQFSVTVVDIPGHCLPTLDVKQTDAGVEVTRRSDGCNTSIYAILRMNPAWSDSISLHLRSGQVDVKPSVLAHSKALQAQVNVGDIFGHAAARRTGLLGATLAVVMNEPASPPDGPALGASTADAHHVAMVPKVTVKLQVGAGQITLHRQ